MMTEREMFGSGVIPTLTRALSLRRVRVVALVFSVVRAQRLDDVRWPWLYA